MVQASRWGRNGNASPTSTRPKYLLRVGAADRERLVDVYEAKMPTTTEIGIISRELLAPCENHSDKFTIGPHPLLLVEADKAWSGRIDCMVPAHLHLWKCRGRLLGIRNDQDQNRARTC